METVCQEMKNYSEFVEDGKKIYRRYQNRPGVKKPLNLKNFGWSGMCEVLDDVFADNF